MLATGYVASSILLSGFYLRIKDIKIGFIRALSWLSYTKYAMQGVGRVELAGRTWDSSTCQQTSTGQCFLAVQPCHCVSGFSSGAVTFFQARKACSIFKGGSIIFSAAAGMKGQKRLSK